MMPISAPARVLLRLAQACAARGVIPGAGTPRDLVKDALNAVNAISNTIPGFDWANYDLNGDGIIDRLWIVHAGYGEEDGTTLLNRDPVVQGTVVTPDPASFYGEAAVWSHSSAVTPPYSVTQNIAAGAVHRHAGKRRHRRVCARVCPQPGRR